ncbi:MAG: Minf_1886 family protein [Planctomycetota bacterium]
MPKNSRKTISEVSRELGKYSIDAFEFLHRGLDFTVQRAHGPPAPGLSELVEWLQAHGSAPSDLEALATAGELPEPILAFIEHLGGIEAASSRVNRHIGGEELCWGLRDLALRQWGLLASTVLRYWGIRSTKDFGRMVFALVQNGLLQKQPHDQIEDFDKIYDFDTALDQFYKLDCSPKPTSPTDSE